MRKSSLLVVLSVLATATAQAETRGARSETATLLAASGLTSPFMASPSIINQFFDASRTGLPAVNADSRRQNPAPAPRKTAKPPVSTPAPKALIAPLRTPGPIERHIFASLLSHPETTDRYDDFILKYARRYGLDARLIKAVISAESEFLPAALSPRGARGLMQVMPATAGEFGVNPKNLHDPESNIAAGAAYLAQLFKAAWKHFKLGTQRFHDAPLWLIQRVIAAYNAGPRFLFHEGGVFPQTRLYIRKVLLYYGSSVTNIRRPKTSPASRIEIPVGAAVD
jgi:soluble lytic murein transglycosylase-like protein